MADRDFLRSRNSTSSTASTRRETSMPGIKRSRPESDETNNMTGNQKRKGDGPMPYHKKQKTGGPGKQHPKYQPKKFSLNPLKDKIRDLRRQLSRNGEDMPANVRVEKERELASKEHELWVAQGERLKQDMIPKYHKARFFGMCQCWTIWG